jgi:hypothetical protein
MTLNFNKKLAADIEEARSAKVSRNQAAMKANQKDEFTPVYVETLRPRTRLRDNLTRTIMVLPSSRPGMRISSTGLSSIV